MRRIMRGIALALAVAGGAAILLGRFMALDAPLEPGALPLYPHAHPEAGSEERWTSFLGQRVVRNVTRPTLTPFLPESSRGTGAAVIIAPGGGFQMLSLDNEGWPVAQWFADRGVAAFVLKYRLRRTPDSDLAWMAQVVPRIVGLLFAPVEVSPQPEATADALQAMALVRAHAAQWGVDPGRIGMLGFSAGARTVLSAALDSPAGARPAFLALVYGPMDAVAAPQQAPPLFAALALDDPLFGDPPFALLDSWRDVGATVTFHAYQSGSHGFGMGRPGTDSMHLMDDLGAWLVGLGVLDERDGADAPGGDSASR